MLLFTMILQAAAGAALGKAGVAIGAAVAAIAASAGNLRTAMIIAAGMIEGAALFAIIVCLLALVL